MLFQRHKIPRFYTPDMRHKFLLRNFGRKIGVKFIGNRNFRFNNFFVHFQMFFLKRKDNQKMNSFQFSDFSFLNNRNK